MLQLFQWFNERTDGRTFQFYYASKFIWGHKNFKVTPDWPESLGRSIKYLYNWALLLYCNTTIMGSWEYNKKRETINYADLKENENVRQQF